MSVMPERFNSTSAPLLVYPRGYKGPFDSDKAAAIQVPIEWYRAALELRDHHLRGTPEVVRDRCQCVGCEMGRALEGRPTLNGGHTGG